jgi:hypothetical protein
MLMIKDHIMHVCACATHRLEASARRPTLAKRRMRQTGTGSTRSERREGVPSVVVDTRAHHARRAERSSSQIKLQLLSKLSIKSCIVVKEVCASHRVLVCKGDAIESDTRPVIFTQ